jgi:hypothetical protein
MTYNPRFRLTFAACPQGPYLLTVLPADPLSLIYRRSVGVKGFWTIGLQHEIQLQISVPADPPS